MNKILILVGNVVQLVEEDNFSDTLWKNWTRGNRQTGRLISVLNSGHARYQIKKVSL